MRSNEQRTIHLVRSVVGFVCGMVLSAASAMAADSVKSVGDWQVSGHLGDKEKISISGLRCVAVAARSSCLMVADEIRSARVMEMEGEKLVAGEKIKLLPNIPKLSDEADAEGVDVDGGFYYVTGSHGLSKGRERQSSRYFVYRLPIDPGTGMPGVAEPSNRLLPIMAALPELRGFVNRGIEAGDRPREHGLNIEGLVVADGRALFGLRGPVEHGNAYIVSIAVDALFGSGPAETKLFAVELGKGTGIRDMAEVEGGLLLLGGPEEEKAGHAAVFLWDGRSDTAQALGQLDLDGSEDAKPEALLVLGEDSDNYRVLVLSDNVKNGEPREYRLPKRPTM